MISITLNKLTDILHGRAFGRNITFDNVSTDTRKAVRGCLFVALKGKYFDGHDFVMQAQKAGVSALLVNRKMDINLPQVVVKNTRIAFSELAAWIRQQVSTKVVALTGSSGKTSVKEMTVAILKQNGNTLYTIDNLNNDIGVSMTLLRLTKKYDYAVIELGTNRQGEIAWTVNLTRPEVVLVTNLAASHIEGFGSIENVAQEKGEIYAGLSMNGTAIVNEDSNDLLNWKDIIGLRKTWYFSLQNTYSDFSAKNIHIASKYTEFTLQTPIGNIDLLLPLPGYHNISNALAASALSISMGASLTMIKQGLENFNAIPGRLFSIFLTKDQLLIDDSYNANVGSMIAAVQVLSKMPGYQVIVVGDMVELGDKSEFYHSQIGKIIKEFDLDLVLSIGKFSWKISQESNIGEHFHNKKKLINRIKTLLTKHPIITILVKGSRSTAMEEIVYAIKESKKCYFG